MKTKFLSYLLLFAFGMLLSPRSMWHECDNHHNQDNGISTHLEKKCYACDYDMNSAEEPVQFNPCFFSAFYPQPIDVKVEFRAIEFVRIQLLRGPPIV